MSDLQIINWSYSAMDTFETCPRQYQAKYVTKEVPYVETAPAKWGNDVHLALENNIKDGTPLPSNMVMYQRLLDAVKLRGQQLNAEIIAEQPVALTRDLKPVSWFTKKTAKNPVWFRLKVDVTLLAGNYAEMFDWKTGKMKDDPDQLHLYAMAGFILHPHIERIKTGFVWLKDDVITPPMQYTRDQLPEMLDYWVQKYEVLEQAWMLDKFPPKPSGLCNGWCEVKSCPHWKPKR